MIHLDTNFLIQALVPSSAAEAKLQTWKKDGEVLAISSIAWSEFQIAAVAMRRGARMATANASDFTPFQTHGLTLA